MVKLYAQKTLKALAALLLFCNFSSFTGLSQGPIPSVGTNFWLGFLSNYTSSSSELNLFISGNEATSGTVSIPLQGWSVTFNIVPGVTTVVPVPIANGNNSTNDMVSNHGIHVVSDDTISLFSINFQSYTADGAMILPVKSIGTDYIASSYQGTYGASEFLIVATEDGTEIEITPSATTLGGHPAGVTYTIQLNEGQTYQVKSDGDLTGSTIKGTEASGECRPFALFSGVECANIPLGCTACDHIYDQNYSIDTWGQRYFIVPFLTSTTYTYRILARDDNTTVTLDNGSTIVLNSGQYATYNSVPDEQVISADKPISVIQFMEGITCSGGGDPSMLVLNSEERKINDVTFSTVASTVITTHTINIIVESTSTSNVMLDGALVNSSSFTPFTSDPLKSYAQLPLSAGSHNLQLNTGFTAYVYGMGEAESYAYSVGSFLPSPNINIDTAYCSNDSVVLTPGNNLFDPWWATQTNPSDTILVGQVLVLQPPIVNDIYIVTGQSLASGCVKQYFYSVESPNPPVLSITTSEDTVCKFTDIQFNLSINPISSSYNILWEPSYMFDDPTSQNPVLNAQETGWYKVSVSTMSGCGESMDSVYIVVNGGGVKDVIAKTDQSILCVPDTAQLDVDILQIVEFEDFNGGTSPSLWSSISGGVTADSCGSISGDALYFNGAGTRIAQTAAFDVSQGGTIEFFLEISNGIAPCDNADFGENVKLQYSIDGGATWVDIATYFENGYANFTYVTAQIPAGAMTASTMFRWTQPVFSAADQDVWSLDNVSLSTYNSTGVTINWHPAGDLSASNIEQPLAFPTAATWFVVDVTSGTCVYQDSVFINAAPSFTLQTSNDTILCSTAGIPLSTVASNSDVNLYSWAPTTDLTAPSSSSTVANPATTTNYVVTVTSPQGCVVKDSVLITVSEKITLNLFGDDAICIGQSVDLTSEVNKALFDNFDGGAVNSDLWANVNGATLSTDCGAVSGDALHFDANTRIAETNSFNTLAGGQITFSIVFGSAGFPCEDADAGEDVALEYSVDGGTNWINISTYNTTITSFTQITVPIPAGAMSANTLFRWRQVSFSGSGTDNWALDNVSIDIQANVTNYTYAWYEGTSLLGTLDSLTVTPGQLTTYTFVMTDTVLMCSVSDSITVSAGPLFTLTTTDDQTLCVLVPVALSSVPDLPGTYDYTWTPSASLINSNGQTPTASPGQTTMYHVTVSSDLGCTVEDSVQITVASQISSQIIGDTTICTGVATNLELALSSEVIDHFNGAVPDPALWANVNGALLNTNCGSVSGNALHFNTNGTRIAQTIPLNTLTGGQITFWIVFGSGSFPCEDADAGEDVALEYSIDGGVNWINISTYPSSITSFTQMTVNIPAGAMTASTIFRWRQVSFSGSGSDNWALDDVSIEFQATTSNFTVEWFDENNQSVSTNFQLGYTPPSSTMFTVVLTDTVANCQTIDSVQLNIIQLTVDAGNDTTLCPGTAYQLEGTTSSLAPLVSWSNGTNLNNPGILSPQILQENNLTYVLTVTEGSCSVQDSVYIDYHQDFNLIAQNSFNVCVTDSLAVPLSSGSNYSWTNSASISNAASNNPVFGPSATTTYELTYNYGLNCVNTDTITVNVIDFPIIDLVDSMIKCPETSLNLLPIYTFVDQVNWSTTEQTNGISVLPPGIYWVDATNGCTTVRDSIVIENYAVEAINLGNDTSLCNNVFIDILPVFAPTSTFTWSNGSPDLHQVVEAPLNLSIIVEDLHSCLTYDTIILSEFPILNVTLGPDETFCSYESQVLSVNQQNLQSYLWNTGDDTPSITVDMEGTYSVTVTDFNNCRYYDTIFADEIIAPFPIITGVLTFCPGDQTTLGLTANYASYLWSTNAVTPTVSVGLPDSLVWVVVRDQFNCVGADSVYISQINPPQIDLGPDQVICPNDYVQLNGAVIGGTNYVWNNNQVGPSIFAQLGTFILQAEYLGCPISDTVNVGLDQTPQLDLGSNYVICPDEPITVTALASYYDSLVWNDGTQGISYVQDLNYHMFDTVNIVATAYGCGSISDTLSIYVENCYCILYIPNTFTPDGNDFNNTFKISHLCDFATFDLKIVNRWNEVVFATNDPNFEWDGRNNNGDLIQDGVYTWILNYESMENIEDLELVTRIGHILILK